jgi:dipeptidyl aminopeptidase/acylaminoacyl peptidase
MISFPQTFLSGIVNEIVRPLVLLIGITAVACQLCASVQLEQKTISKGRSMGTHTTCYDESTGELTGSHRSRTSVLISPDGHYRAYVESESVASRTANAESEECGNTSKLFVAAKSQSFRAVLVIRPLRERHGNGIDVVDWSPTGHRLLLTESVWEWGSDVGETVVRTYDADSGSLSSGSGVAEGFRTYVGKACAAIFQAVGFSPSGRAVVTAEPYFDYGEDSPSQDSCVQKKGFWLIDFAIPAVHQLPDDYKVEHYGKGALE